MSETYRTSIQIDAAPNIVFEYFTDPALLVRWMGDHARLDPQAGGLFAVDINGVIIRGSYVRIIRPESIEIAWGEAGNEAMPPGSTRLLVRFIPQGTGTRVELEHSGLLANEAAKHAAGWPHFLERLQLASGGNDPGPDPWALNR